MASYSEKTDLQLLAKELKKKVNGLLTVYVLLIVGTILFFFLVVGLCGLAVWGMWEAGRIYGRAVVLLIGAIVVAGICVKVVLEPLFKIFQKRKNDGKEIKRKDYPELFALIDSVVKEVDCLEPKHVYISDECNAYVNYPSTWGYLFPGRQNLTIGIPLLFGMNKTELKSILSHEFGHFTQKSVNVNRIANLSEFLCGAIAASQEELENANDDSYEAKARFFAKIATKIMLGQYHKVAPLNGILSRAQEYDADKFSYEIVGTEGCLSALSKLQDLSQRWDNVYLRWLWDQICDHRAPADVRDLFQKLSARIDEISIFKMAPSVHFEASTGEFDSRLSSVENTDTHPSNNQRSLAILSYAPQPTQWDDSPAYDYFPDAVVSEMFNRVVLTLKKRRFTNTTEFIKKDIQDNELLEMIEGATPVILNSFYVDDLFYDKELLEEAKKSEAEVEFPFTSLNVKRLREYRQARDDYSTLQRIVDENSSKRRFLYNGNEYNGTNVPISEHREYCKNKFALAWTIALECNIWMIQHARGNEQLDRLFSDMIWMKQVDIELRDGWNNMQTVQQIGQSHNTSTKAVEFVNSLEERFRSLAESFFEKGENDLSIFEWMCSHLGTPESVIKQAVGFFEKGHREHEQDFYDAYSIVGSVFEKHSAYNWDMLKSKLITPYLQNQTNDN